MLKKMMKNDDITGKLISAAIAYVSVHPKSAKEIRTYLLKKLRRMDTEDISYVEQAISRLTELRYVDDVAYAEAFITSRNRSKPKGKALLSLELSRKGVDQDSITTLFARGENDGESELALAQKAFAKKQKSLAHLPLMVQKKKLFSFLLRRGFRSEIVSSIVDGRV